MSAERGLRTPPPNIPHGTEGDREVPETSSSPFSPMGELLLHPVRIPALSWSEGAQDKKHTEPTGCSEK